MLKRASLVDEVRVRLGCVSLISVPIKCERCPRLVDVDCWAQVKFGVNLMRGLLIEVD